MDSLFLVIRCFFQLSLVILEFGHLQTRKGDLEQAVLESSQDALLRVECKLAFLLGLFDAEVLPEDEDLADLRPLLLGNEEARELPNLLNVVADIVESHDSHFAQGFDRLVLTPFIGHCSTCEQTGHDCCSLLRVREVFFRAWNGSEQRLNCNLGKFHVVGIYVGHGCAQDLRYLFLRKIAAFEEFTQEAERLNRSQSELVLGMSGVRGH